MIEGLDIVVFSDDWGRHPSSCQHIVRRLASHNRVLWVNTIGIRTPRLSVYDIKRGIEKILGWILSSREKVPLRDELVAVLDPVIVPYSHFGLVRAFNRRRVAAAVNRALRDHGMSNPVVVTTFPITADLVGALGESLHVYYCVDDFTKWPGADEDLVRTMEEELIGRCDLVVATAEDLVVRKRRAGKEPILLRHGVDADHFASGTRGGFRPSFLVPTNGPVVGFFGAVSSWLDFPLLCRVAKECPDLSFVFLGPLDTNPGELAAFQNVHFTGKVNYNELPSLAAWFDVATIPFVLNDMTKGVNPLKLLEYFALGLPVVSTPLPEVVRFSNLVYLANTPEQFVFSLREAIAERDPEKAIKRRITAAENSWERVAQHFGEIVKEGLMQKGNNNA